MKKSMIEKALGVLVLILFFVTLVQSKESKYDELAGKLSKLEYQTLEEKGTVDHILISSSNCLICLESMESLYFYLNTIGDKVALLDPDTLTKEQRTQMVSRYSIDEIPAILTLDKDQYEVITPRMLKEMGVISNEF